MCEHGEVRISENLSITEAKAWGGRGKAQDKAAVELVCQRLCHRPPALLFADPVSVCEGGGGAQAPVFASYAFPRDPGLSCV